MGYKQTSENHRNPDLKTRYYANSLNETIDEVLALTEKFGYIVINDNRNFKELLVRNSKFAMTVTFYMVSARVTAVDILVGYRGLLDFGYSKKEIISFFTALNKKLTIKRG
ncbi:MAG: hypothetical protein FWE36_06795 [Erysipelotrichales bacterium]|nr:hypothetical protein [Erysipelotrichales bacterium]